MPKIEHVDAVVIGTSIRGLVTTHVLNSLGCRAVLADRGHTLGGVDGSFTTAAGTRFDHGMHVLDYERSGLATRLFTKVTDGEVHRVRLQRAIVLRNSIMPYAPKPSEMPEELRAMLPSDNLVDDIGSELPTREKLGACYGKEFANLIFDEVLPSYPCEARHLEFGVEEERLLQNIYPWFFPRAERREITHDESRAFHDKLRSGVSQEILYPKEGGFGGFAAGFARKFDPDCIELLLDAGEMRLELEPGTHTVKWVEAGGRRFAADHVFWAASWPALCTAIDVPCQEIATDRLVVGSFRLNRPASTDYHEILIGDPSHRLSRVYFPARFRESDEPLMQVEFAFPKAEDRSLEADWWRETWLDDLRRLGVLEENHSVEEFDFKTFTMHFNSFGMEGEPLHDADASLLKAGSNIHPVVPSMANVNLNYHVPRAVRDVAAVLAERDG